LVKDTQVMTFDGIHTEDAKDGTIHLYHYEFGVLDKSGIYRRTFLKLES
jgi:hypothetical protein